LSKVRAAKKLVAVAKALAPIRMLYAGDAEVIALTNV